MTEWLDRFADFSELTEKDEQVVDTRGDVMEQVKELEEQDLDNVFGDPKPDAYFDEEIKPDSSNISENIDNVMQYISKKSDALQNFDISVLGFKYQIFEDAQEKFEENIDVVGDQELEDFLSASAIIPVLVKVKFTEDDELAETSEINGMIIFSVVDDEVITDDLMKAEDGEIYPLTNEGLYLAFNK